MTQSKDTYNDAKISNDAKVKSAKWYPTSPAMSDADRKVAVRDQVRFEDGYMVGYKAALASETHIEIDDCSMLGKPSSKLGFYTVTMFPDDGKPVNLRLSKDVAEALASVLTIGGEIDDSTELPPVQAQPQDDTRELVKQARDHIRAFNHAMDGPHPEAAYIAKLCNALEAQPQGDRKAVHVVFDGMPGPEGPRFIECEDGNGRSIRAGEWRLREDGFCELVIPLQAKTPVEITDEMVERARKASFDGFARSALIVPLLRAALEAAFND